jgi:hypothetical protein
MASWTTYQDISTKSFYSTGDPFVAVQRYYDQKHSVRVAPSRGAIYRNDKQSEDAGNMPDKRRALPLRAKDVG